MSRQFEVGDVVMVRHEYLTGRPPELTLVNAVTKTLAFVVDSSVKYNRKSGKQTGTYGLTRIEHASPEELEGLNHRTVLQTKIRQTDWSKVSIEVMEKVVDLVSSSVNGVTPKTSRYTLTLEHTNNLWIRGGYREAKPLGDNPRYVEVNSLEDASNVFSDWVINNDLGSGNMTKRSGELYNADKVLVAVVEMNGKIFDLDDVCIYTP